MDSTPTELAGPDTALVPFRMRALSWGLGFWTGLFALALLTAVISLLVSEGAGTVRLFIYCTGALFDLHFDDLETAKTVGTVLMLAMGGAILLVGVTATRSAARNTTAWKPAAAVLGAISTAHVTAISLSAGKIGAFLPLSGVVVLVPMVAGLLVYVAAVGYCWVGAGSAAAPAAGTVAKARAAGIGTAVLIQLFWIVGTFTLLLGGREYAGKVVCHANLRQIGRACYRYAENRNGDLPDSLDVLVQECDLPAAFVECPKGPDGASEGRYVYLCDFLRSRQLLDDYGDCLAGPDGGGPPADVTFEKLSRLHYRLPIDGLIGSGTIESDSIPIAWDPAAAHGRTGLMNVLFLDMHVETMPPQEFDTRLRGLRDEREHLFARLIRMGRPAEPH